MTRRAPNSAMGFTLIEVVVVLMVLGILAAASVPAMGAMLAARSDAAGDRIEATLAHARSLAMATGDAHAVLIEASDSRFRLIAVEPDTTGVVEPVGVLGTAREPLVLDDVFTGVRVTSYLAMDGGATSPVWFDYRGLPELRDEFGRRGTGTPRDAEIVVSGGVTVRVDAVTGVVWR